MSVHLGRTDNLNECVIPIGDTNPGHSYRKNVPPKCEWLVNPGWANVTIQIKSSSWNQFKLDETTVELPTGQWLSRSWSIFWPKSTMKKILYGMSLKFELTITELEHLYFFRQI